MCSRISSSSGPASAHSLPSCGIAAGRNLPNRYPTERLRSTPSRNVFGWEIAHAAVSRRPPIILCTIVARTEDYTHAAKAWDSSLVQGAFPAAPCQPSAFATFPPTDNCPQPKEALLTVSALPSV
jgi:hypothetical protein